VPSSETSAQSCSGAARVVDKRGIRQNVHLDANTMNDAGLRLCRTPSYFVEVAVTGCPLHKAALCSGQPVTASIHKVSVGKYRYFKYEYLKYYLKYFMKYFTSGYATWFTAGGAIRIALRQLWQTWKLRHL